MVILRNRRPEMVARLQNLLCIQRYERELGLDKEGGSVSNKLFPNYLLSLLRKSTSKLILISSGSPTKAVMTPESKQLYRDALLGFLDPTWQGPEPRKPFCLKVVRG